MDFGICVPHYGKPLDIERILTVARSAEELGFASIWVTDHVFVPRTLDIIYRDNMLEPLALLSHLAAVVPRVRLGTSVLILPYRNPIIVAKMLATIDQLSHGRLIFGAAVGWMEDEFRALNVPFSQRGALSDESLQIIRAIWTQGLVNHEGTFYQYEDMQASPAPFQQPSPPIWIGGNSARARRRVVELGDGWHTSGLDAASMAPGCAHLRDLWAQHGRQGQPTFSARVDLAIEAVSDSVLSYPPRPGRPTRIPVRGSVSAIVDSLGAFQELGLSHIVFETSTQSHQSTLATMEAFVQRVQPQLG
ncbi:MAG: LLM class F420-dependent oxidoreductase [Candidatus Tectimicrobiota bacterium]